MEYLDGQLENEIDGEDFIYNTVVQSYKIRKEKMENNQLQEYVPNIYEMLAIVQSELKAPKGQFNKFGKYKYRSCEDILEAVKPIAHKHGCMVTITDSIEHVGDRYYVKATASFWYSGERKPNGSDLISVSAYAREEEAKKGMDSSQVTGTASSYARKYALNGLFCIDDTKDSDATNTHGREEQSKPDVDGCPKNSAPANPTYERDVSPTLNQLDKAQNMNQLQSIWIQLPPDLKENQQVFAKKEEMKQFFSEMEQQ